MRQRPARAPGLARGVGTLAIIVLPLAVVWEVRAYVSIHATLPVYALLFLIVSLVAQLGLILRRWGNINLGRLLFDLGLSVVAGAVTWGVVHVAVHRGGGPVDPSLVAAIFAYILAIWSGQHP